MTRLLFLFLLTLTHGQLSESRNDYRSCNIGLENIIHCDQTWIYVGNKVQCTCKTNCLRFVLECTFEKKLKGMPDESFCSAPYQKHDIEYFATFAPGVGQRYKGKVWYSNHLYTVYCDEDADTVQTGSASCNSNGGLSVTSNPKCAKTCTRSIPENIQCPDNRIWATGYDTVCRCKYGCRSITLRCFENGYLQFVSPNSDNCAEPFETKVMDTTNARKVSVTYTNGDFKVNCDAGETVTAGMASCTEDGKLEVTVFPDCGIQCTSLPAALKCENEGVAQYGDSRNCTCRDSCRSVKITCLVTGKWSDPRQECYEQYSKEITFDNEQNVYVSYTPANSIKEASLTAECPSGIRTISQGAITCNDGEINLTKPPSCACRNSQERLIRCKEDSVKAGEEMHCICKNNCRPVSLKCLDDGTLELKNLYNHCVGYYAGELNTGQNVELSYTYIDNFRITSNYRSIQLHCDKAQTLTVGSAYCKSDSGELTDIVPPLCDIPCTTFPEGLQCENLDAVRYKGTKSCNCVNSCRPVTLTCLANGMWSDFRQQCSEQYSYWNKEKNVYVSYKPASVHSTTASLKAECPSGIRTISQGAITCNDGEINLTQPPSCDLPCRTIPAGVKCLNEGVADYVAGTTRRCTCSKSCQTVILTCRADGHWSSPDAQCQEPYENRELALSNGAKVYASYSPETDYPVARCAPGIQTVKPGRVTCSGGNIYVSQRPSCGLPCKTVEAGIKCGNVDELRYNDTRMCNYLDKCKPATATCAANGGWNISHLSRGHSHTLKNEISEKENMRIIYTIPSNGVNPYFSVICKLKGTTLTPGSVTCSQGDVSIARRPECGCTPVPPNDLTCEQNKTRHGESINCNCTATCRPVTLTCDTNRAWTDVSQLCNETIDRRSDNVVSTFNNGTYVFECVEGHQPISGSHVAVCENGQLNVTEELQLRCEPAAEIPMVLWASAGAAALILVIILIVIAIYCHRRNHGAAVVTEEIGFVTINDLRVPVNPVPASPTSVDAGMEENDLYGAFDGRMEENDLYGAYNGPRNEEVEENELYGAFDGAKNELQMQDDDNMYMNYSGPGDEQMEENECYGAYQGPRRKH